MKIEQSELKDLMAVVTLTIEPADYQEEVAKQLKEVRHKAQMPGFRPGMVPAGLVKKMYGKGILADVLNKLVGENLQKHIEDNKLNVLGDPLPSEQSPKIDLDNEESYTFMFDIAVAPEFDAKLTGKNKLTEYVIDVTDEMVNNQIQSYCARFGEYTQAEEVAEGDIVKGIAKQVDGEIVKEGAILNPAYMKQKTQQKKFIGAKKGAVITFNPTKAFGSEVEVSSLLGITKEQAEALTSDFTFEIQEITRHTDAAINGELFAKVYGENTIKDEAEFRAKVRAEIEANMAEDSKYKFGLDAKEAIMKKMEKIEFPVDFLKRWVLATNEKMTAEELEKDFDKMLEELKWHLAKDQLMKEYKVDVQKEDVEAYAKEVARMQFMQYGLMHIDDQYLTNYANEMLKNENQLRGIVERVAENKIYEALKGVVKIEQKKISHEDFGKLFN
ncbi:MAG: trigger factor [Paludibacteraceae bacterium]|nr:trigger factor [Paludibacteraceae bacterium]